MQTDKTIKARIARRKSAARRRFERHAAEMRLWGCEVTIPDELTVPTVGSVDAKTAGK